MKKSIIIYCILILLFGSGANIYLSYGLDSILRGNTINIDIFAFERYLEYVLNNNKCWQLYLIFEGFLVVICLLLLATMNKTYKSRLVKITNNISIPAPAGEGQYGRARFQTEREKRQNFDRFTLNKNNQLVQMLLKKGKERYKSVKNPKAVTNEKESQHAKEKLQLIDKGGIVLNVQKKNSREIISYVGDDVHTLIIGATRCGKTRCLVMQTLCTLALAGEGIVVNDPKGELYHYTHCFLENLGYKVNVLDFQSPNKSSCYNPLQPIIDAVNEKNINLAQTRTWDLVCFLVTKSDKSEPLWQNGEMSVLAAAILCVVYDNQKAPKYQNLTNVYWFIANMCKDVKVGNTTIKPIVEYVKTLPDSHPSKPLLGISDVAPSKTAGSFYTSALTTLRLFTANDIYGITKKSDFTLDGISERKEVLFFILPDQNTTYYPIVTLIVSQQYERLVSYAKTRGNRLSHNVNFILDEFGNFTEIADMGAKLTVGGGYGILFSFFLQDFNQLKKIYGEETARIIKGNCQLWIYLQTNDSDTAKEFETRMGTYTTSSYSLGSSTQQFTKPSSNQNMSLLSRQLLFSNEIQLIKRPYQLVISTNLPAMMKSPDVSQWLFNDMLGLGSKKHNQKLIESDENKRRERNDANMEIPLWGIWNDYIPQREFGEDSSRRQRGGHLDDY